MDDRYRIILLNGGEVLFEGRWILEKIRESLLLPEKILFMNFMNNDGEFVMGVNVKQICAIQKIK